MTVQLKRGLWVAGWTLLGLSIIGFGMWGVMHHPGGRGTSWFERWIGEGERRS